MNESTKISLVRELLRLAKEVVMDEDNVLELPDTRQTYNFDCGAKATQTVLAYYGFDVREDELMKELGTTDEGTDVGKIIEVLRGHGLQTYDGTMSLRMLKTALNRGFPVILPLQAWADDPETIDWKTARDEGHYVIAVGFDGENMFFEDPSSFEKVYLEEGEFLDRWHDYGEDGTPYINYGIIVVGEPKYEEDKAVHMD